MTEQFKTQSFASAADGIGAWVARPEDERLLTGLGRYTDDVDRPGQAYLRMVRSQYAHGVIRGIDAAAAAALPGVLAVFTGADLAAAGYGPFKFKVPLPGRDGMQMRHADEPVMTTDRVRYVGDPVAFVVAESESEAADAAEAVLVDIDPLPAVTDEAAAMASGAALVHDDVPGNVGIDYLFGDSAAVAAAFASAAHVTRATLVNNRIIVNALEPRAAVGEWDAAAQRYVLHVGCQGVMGQRATLAEILRVPPDSIRVLTGSVGGSFGMKSPVFPETIAVLHAARALGRPVKWTATRGESFVSDHHGRDQTMACELALDRDGTFLAIRVTGSGNLGAFANHFGPVPATGNVAKNMIGPYRTPLIEVAAKAVFTHTVPVGPYRGAGRPEANYNMQRLVDQAAFEMGLDPVEIRRRNLIAPSALPYRTPAGTTYDSGRFEDVLDRALELADWAGFAERRRASEAQGLVRGRGIGQYLEVTAPANPEMGGIRFEADGTVTMLTGTLDYGQGHAASFAQVLSTRLGIPVSMVRLQQGDSDVLLAGGGTGGSRSIMASGTALARAADQVIERGKAAASSLLEASIGDIEFVGGRFRIVGTDRSISLIDMAAKLAASRPAAGSPQDLSVGLVDPGVPATYPNGVHIAEVEIDPTTGVTTVVRYSGVDDFGTVVNPMIVEGQMHGGVVQGIGQALLEQTVYSETGQLLTGSFMDYCLPRADDVPLFTFASLPSPATTNPLGVKGCGEAGCAGSISSVMNAVMDALRPLGVHHLDMPATPERVWSAIRAARGA